VRQKVVHGLLDQLSPKLKIESALDLGCGVGYFSRFLADLGLRVTAIDGREENVMEGRRRNPDIEFATRNAEDPNLGEIGEFDLVLCVGLLYHLENPFRAIRNLYALTRKILVVESMCAPGTQPTMDLLDEERSEDQGLNYVAFYPTESCMTKMLYRAGFPFVYSFRELRKHERFHDTIWRRRERMMLVASTEKLSTEGLLVQSEVKRSWEIWTTPLGRWKNRLSSASRRWKVNERLRLQNLQPDSGNHE
jgi:tRNA (mo5U34)-methyltransferase